MVPKSYCGGLLVPVTPDVIGGNLLLFHPGTLFWNYRFSDARPGATSEVALNAHKGFSCVFLCLYKSSLCWLPGYVSMIYQIVNGSRICCPYRLVKVKQKQGLVSSFHSTEEWKVFFLLWGPEEKQCFGKMTGWEIINFLWSFEVRSPLKKSFNLLVVLFHLPETYDRYSKMISLI